MAKRMLLCMSAVSCWDRFPILRMTRLWLPLSIAQTSSAWTHANSHNLLFEGRGSSWGQHNGPPWNIRLIEESL